MSMRVVADEQDRRCCKRAHVYVALSSLFLTIAGTATAVHALVSISDLTSNLGDLGEAWYLQLSNVVMICAASIAANAVAVLPSVINGKVPLAKYVRFAVWCTCSVQVVVSYIFLFIGFLITLLSGVCKSDSIADASSLFSKLVGQGQLGDFMANIDISGFCGVEGQPDASEHGLRLVIGCGLAAWSQTAMLVCLTHSMFEGRPRRTSQDDVEESSEDVGDATERKARKASAKPPARMETRMSRTGDLAWKPAADAVDDAGGSDPDTSDTERLIEELSQRQTPAAKMSGMANASYSKSSAKAPRRMSNSTSGTSGTSVSSRPSLLAGIEEEQSPRHNFVINVLSPNASSAYQTLHEHKFDTKQSDNGHSSASASTTASEHIGPSSLPRLPLGKISEPQFSSNGASSSSSCSAAPAQIRSAAIAASPRGGPTPSSTPPSSRPSSTFSDAPLLQADRAPSRDKPSDYKSRDAYDGGSRRHGSRLEVEDRRSHRCEGGNRTELGHSKSDVERRSSRRRSKRDDEDATLSAERTASRQSDGEASKSRLSEGSERHKLDHDRSELATSKRRQSDKASVSPRLDRSDVGRRSHKNSDDSQSGARRERSDMSSRRSRHSDGASSSTQHRQEDRKPIDDVPKQSQADRSDSKSSTQKPSAVSSSSNRHSADASSSRSRLDVDALERHNDGYREGTRHSRSDSASRTRSHQAFDEASCSVGRDIADSRSRERRQIDEPSSSSRRGSTDLRSKSRGHSEEASSSTRFENTDVERKKEKHTDEAPRSMWQGRSDRDGKRTHSAEAPGGTRERLADESSNGVHAERRESKRRSRRTDEASSSRSLENTDARGSASMGRQRSADGNVPAFRGDRSRSRTADPAQKEEDDQRYSTRSKTARSTEEKMATHVFREEVQRRAGVQHEAALESEGAATPRIRHAPAPEQRSRRTSDGRVGPVDGKADQPRPKRSSRRVSSEQRQSRRDEEFDSECDDLVPRARPERSLRML